MSKEKNPDFEKMNEVSLEVAEVLSKVVVKHKMGYQDGLTAIAVGVDNLLCALADTMRTDKKNVREQFINAFKSFSNE